MEPRLRDLNGYLEGINDRCISYIQSLHVTWSGVVLRRKDGLWTSDKESAEDVWYVVLEEALAEIHERELHVEVNSSFGAYIEAVYPADEDFDDAKLRSITRRIVLSKREMFWVTNEYLSR